jgi:hypothetical protein
MEGAMSGFGPENSQPYLRIEALRRKKSRAHLAQLVEHILGKDEVTGSIPVVGSISDLPIA